MRDALAAAQAAPVHADAERVARDVLVERLLLDLDRFDAGDLHSSLNVIASPVQDVRQLFDLLPTGTDDDAADLARRMARSARAHSPAIGRACWRACAAGGCRRSARSTSAPPSATRTRARRRRADRVLRRARRRRRAVRGAR